MAESPRKDKKKKPLTNFALYDKKLCDQFFRNAQTVSSFDDAQTQQDDVDTQDREQVQQQKDPGHEEDQDGQTLFKCSYCQVTFEQASEHRNHYKQDWHRYNLKRSLESKPVVSEPEFCSLIEGKDADTLSISGSDSSEDEDEDSGYLELQRNPKFFFKTETGQILSLFKTVLVDPKNKLTQPSDQLLIQSIGKEKCNWAIFMVGGGHFAAAVFNGATVLLHKTFHSYTTRKKQGGSQGAADNRSGTTHKSAGASLRRYNEMTHMQHIQDITKQWEKELSECTLIFIRASSHSRATLFGGKTPALKKSDPRLRTVPFPTKRATFSEVKRVYELLVKVDITDNIPIAIHNSPAKPKRTVNSNIHRSKSRESKQRELPGAGLGCDEDADLVHQVQNMGLSEEQDLIQANKKKRGKRKNNKKAGINSDLAECKSDDEDNRLNPEIENQILTGVRSGNLKLFNQGLSLLEEEFSEKEIDKEREAFLNKSLGETKLTYLHFASQLGFSGIVVKLLECGADPCVKDKQGRVPYSLAKDKETRGAFIKSRSLFPNRHDWKKAQVPEPLSQEELTQKENKQKEKKKAKQQERKEKLKVQKQEDKVKKQEAEEKARYLALSDREKRALAAERRIAAANSGSVLLRCFLCGQDITGKVPFNYNDNNFCSVGCVKKHRANTS